MVTHPSIANFIRFWGKFWGKFLVHFQIWKIDQIRPLIRYVYVQ
ncbi:hypothetical protein HMPREF9450_01905 [Alistipes indistinctus YIT 12060]|uniref:Uncharacterized protein n=1 Tax=Alistipes indistinctus YIT 12060 TaxID=742725 RepID=G5HB90_9BACT|nr:hypothetical protein HMPREF9450_01905 [Alistipes indistinctus YIT 12060]